jgi:amino acid adenylation domain-containing protein
MHRREDGDPRVQCLISIEGPIESQRLKELLLAVVERHEILRTSFRSTPGVRIPIQVIASEADLFWQAIDLGGRFPLEQASEMQRLIERERAAEIDLTEARLLRATLASLSNQKHVLVITIPALCADLLSLHNLYRELIRQYKLKLEGEPLQEEIIQFAEYSEWRNELLLDGDAETGKQFWRDFSSRQPSGMLFPFERTEAARNRSVVGRDRVSIELPDAASIEAAAELHGVSMEIFLLACWQSLLWRITRDSEILIGVVGNGRKYEEFRGAIGPFAGPTPAPTNITSSSRFSDLVQRTNEAVAEAREWQEYFISEENVAIDGKPVGFSAGFEFYEYPVEESVGAVSFSYISQSGSCERFKIKLTCLKQETAVVAEFPFASEKFCAKDIQKVASQFKVLLTKLMARPDSLIEGIELLDDIERRRLVVELNETARDYLKKACIHQLFERQCEITPDGVAVVFKDQHLTYRALNHRANQFARWMRRNGVGPETIVGLELDRSIDLLVSILAVLKAGGAYLALDRRGPKDRLEFMTTESNPALILIEPSAQADEVDCEGRSPRFVTIAAIHLDEDIENLEPVSGPQNLAYVLYTSGSTGTPKGVMIHHQGVVNYLSWASTAYRLAEGQGAPVHSSIGFDLTVTSMFTPLLSGRSVILLPEEDGVESLSKALQADGDFSLVKITPSHLEALSRLLSPEKAAGRARALIIGGEALSGEALKYWRRNSPQTRLVNEYGPTETVVGCCVYEVGPEETILGETPIGEPIANTQLYVVDRNQQLVAEGELGELLIGGDGVGRGYLKQPELTAERFSPDAFSERPGARLYRSGDLVCRSSNGILAFRGRIDRQVKIRGHRIELGEIETALRKHVTVNEAIVTVREDAPGDKRLAAYLILEASSRLSLADVRKYLAGKLPEYMTPSHFVFLAEAPLTINGKIDYQALPAPDLKRSGDHETHVVRRSLTQQKLYEIWSEILGLDRIGVHENFFDLGGHSLLATQIFSRIRDVFHLELPLRQIFESPTIAGLSAQIEAAEEDGLGLRTPAIEPQARDQQTPLSFAQQRLWFMNQLEPGNPSFNIPGAARIRGSLTPPALEQTLNEILRRNEILRTVFRESKGLPIQVIVPAAEQSVSMIDLCGLAPADRERQVRRLALEEARRPFDLADGPLLRVKILRDALTESVVLYTMHHIISDAWSLGVFTREVSALYQAFSRGSASPLQEPPIQYADFAAWQRNWLRGPVLEDLIDYWRKRLAGYEYKPLLHPDRARPAVQTYKGAVETLRLSSPLTAALYKLSRTEGATLFMTLLSAFQALLHRATGAEDIVIGTDIANRDRKETESIIGFFINHLVLRTDLSGDPSFRSLLGRTRDVCLGAYARQELPFDVLVGALQPERTLSHTPLFQILFVLQNTPLPAIDLPGASLRSIDVGSQTSKFELALFVTENERGISMTWRYNTDLFEASSIRFLIARYETLLASIVGDPDARLSRLELRSEAEKIMQADEKTNREQTRIEKLRRARRRALDLENEELVEIEPLSQGETLPLLFRPRVGDVDLLGWADANRGLIKSRLAINGGLLFRGFGLKSVGEFEHFASTLCSELFAEYGDLPREEMGGKVYGSTPYPSEQTILFHNESSHLHRWPMKIWFYCVKAPQQGGETPLVDCRRIIQLLAPELIERFERRKILYVRNFTDGIDVSWRSFFGTDSKAEVEAYCAKNSIQCEWKNEDGLRTRQLRQAVAFHPETMEKVFFNQMQLHHTSCLAPAVRSSMLQFFKEEDLPRNVYYGDGEPIEDEILDVVRETYQAAATKFRWEEGDVVMLDNMLIAHGRNPYVGPRKIVVTLGEMHQGEAVKETELVGEEA